MSFQHRKVVMRVWALGSRHPAYQSDIIAHTPNGQAFEADSTVCEDVCLLLLANRYENLYKVE